MVDFLKREYPCAGYRVGVPDRQLPTLSQEFRSVLSVEVKIAREPAACLFNVGGGVVQGKREPIKF